MSGVLVVPSVLAADFARLGEQVREAVAAGADRIQVDVMDGHFVPNLTMGPAVLGALRAVTRVPIEAHLMVERPERWIDVFAQAGADTIQVQVESTNALYRTVMAIKEAGCRAAVVLNPATPVEAACEIYPYVDQVNLMTVEPGFGGQAFIAASPAKVRRLAEMAPGKEIEVDGGIDASTAPLVVKAGARALVAGTSVFRYPQGVEAGIAALRASVA